MFAGHPDWDLMVEGHADERGTQNTTWPWVKTSRAVAEYLKIWYSNGETQASSYGEERPLKLIVTRQLG